MLPIPTRFQFGIDIIPVVSAVLLLTVLARLPKTSEIPKHAKVFFLASSVIAMLALLSSLFSWRGIDFISWTVFPLISGFLVLLLTRIESLTFEKFMNAFSLAAGFLAVFDFIGFARGSFRSADKFNFGRFMGSLGDYELSAEIYGLGILVGVYLLIATKSLRIRLATSLGITLLAALIGATQTRSAFLLVISGVLLLILFASASKYLKRAALALIALITIVQVLAFSPLRGLEGILSRLSLVNLNDDIPGLVNRSGVWSYFQGLSSYSNVSWIGNGFSYPFETIQTYPHSLYLWLYWSGGPLVVILLVIAALSALVLNFKRFREFPLDAAATLILITYLLIDQSKIEVSRFASTTWLFWLMLALTFARFKPRNVG